MADQKEDKDTAYNWAKNAEEHDRLRQELTTLIGQVEAVAKATKELDEGQKESRSELTTLGKQVEAIAKATKDLDEAQKESRSELMRRIDSMQDQIDRLASRTDGVHGKIDSTASELRKDLGGLVDQAQTRIREVREDLSEKLVDTNKCIDEVKDSDYIPIPPLRLTATRGISTV